jgi:ZIP family zinc transporter
MACETEEETTFDVDKNALAGFLLVIAAGLSTAIGAAAVYNKTLVQLASKRVLACGLGFSAGVMLYVSFVEIMVKGIDAFKAHGLSEADAHTVATICFFGGLFTMKIIGFVTHALDSKHDCCHQDAPNASGPEGVSLETAEGGKGNQMQKGTSADGQEVVDIDCSIESGAQQAEAKKPADSQQADAKQDNEDESALRAMGLKTALAIGIHNFPEGLATFVATLADPAVGATLAVAIAIHNIPEGLCVALPIYYATGSRLRGFFWALLSGLSEPIGALLGYVIIKSSGDDLNQIVYGILFGLVAGMMIGITITELLPTAQRYDPKDTVLTWSIMVGMLVMAFSLVMFKY